MEQTNIKIGQKPPRRIPISGKRYEKKEDCQTGKCDDSVDGCLERFKYVIDSVVEEYYNVYGRYVYKCDLYSQAYLIFFEVYNEGALPNGKGTRPGQEVLLQRLVSEIHKYCVSEYSYCSRHVDIDSIEISVQPCIMLGEIKRSICKCLLDLTEMQRSVLECYFYEDMSRTAIARELGIPYSVVVREQAMGLRRLRYPKRAKRLRDFIDMYDNVEV